MRKQGGSKDFTSLMENNTDMDGKNHNLGSEVSENFHDTNHEQSC